MTIFLSLFVCYQVDLQKMILRITNQIKFIMFLRMFETDNNVTVKTENVVGTVLCSGLHKWPCTNCSFNDS